jgi:bisphosphoglycerate-independent phosphoglycerate mutase (AlkP superfamily)
MTTDRRLKGQIAELKVQLRAAEKGYIISIPTVPGRYDAILDNGKLERIQIKYAGYLHTLAEGSVVVELRRRGQVYNKNEVDALLVYIPQIDKIVKIPSNLFCGRSSITIRYQPSKNRQVDGIVFAKDFLW